MGKKKDLVEHEAAMMGMADPEEITAHTRAQGALLIDELDRTRPRGPKVPQAVQEQIDFLRGELGRTKRRVRDLEAAAKEHGHPELEAPAIRNGVHVDALGRYYMRRPSGWHRMGTEAQATTADPPAYPIQRLAEPKD